MIIEEARIRSNELIAANIWQMKMDAPRIAAATEGPGQFVNVLGRRDWSHPLRRPMSIAAVQGEQVAIIYKLAGPVTRSLARKQVGEEVSLLGPLGNIFSDWKKPGIIPVLVGGGVGLAPIMYLHNTCRREGIDHLLIIGARTKKEHFLEHDPAQMIHLTTDDGSLGNPGTVMPTLVAILETVTNPLIYACGPEPMLSAVQELGLKRGLRTQLAVERYMACGLGLCQGCVIRRRDGDTSRKSSYQKRYSLTCLEGPVYWGTAVILD